MLFFFLFFRLKQGRYEAQVTSLLDRARVLEVHPCHWNFPKRMYMSEEDVLLLFFHYEGNLDLYRGSDEWRVLASVRVDHCLVPLSLTIVFVVLIFIIIFF